MSFERASSWPSWRFSASLAAARFFKVKALRDVSVEQFNARSDELDPITRRRARHVVTEDDRALRAVDVMRRGDAVELGQLMNACHVSLRDDFEVSSHELNVMVEAAQRRAGEVRVREVGGPVVGPGERRAGQLGALEVGG